MEADPSGPRKSRSVLEPCIECFQAIASQGPKPKCTSRICPYGESGLSDAAGAILQTPVDDLKSPSPVVKPWSQADHKIYYLLYSIQPVEFGFCLAPRLWRVQTTVGHHASATRNAAANVETHLRSSQP